MDSCTGPHRCIHLLAGPAFFPVGGHLSGASEWAHSVHYKEEVYKKLFNKKKALFNNGAYVLISVLPHHLSGT